MHQQLRLGPQPLPYAWDAALCLDVLAAQRYVAVSETAAIVKRLTTSSEREGSKAASLYLTEIRECAERAASDGTLLRASAVSTLASQMLRPVTQSGGDEDLLQPAECPADRQATD